MSDYKALFSVLMEKSGLSSQDLDKRLGEKIESLGHFVNEDVALRLVARDLNISLLNGDATKPCVQIVDLVPNMNNVTLELLVDSKGMLKEFLKKDGTRGQLLRISVYDSSGKAFLVAWDDQTKVVEPLTPGSKVFVRSAYTKSGLKGDVEIHLGNRSRLEVISLSTSNEPKNNSLHKGRIWRTSDLVVFKRKDGTQGTMASFLLKEEDGLIRVLIWNPAVEKLSGIKEGVMVEVSNGVLKTDLNGKQELHVNTIESVWVNQDDISEIRRNLIRLSDIGPNMVDLDVEATIEMVYEVTTTYNGKSFLKMLIRDGETVLPITLWNEKALEFAKKVKIGSLIKLEDCFAKMGPQGLELGISRWSKISIFDK